jgi:hypothetical protein
MRKLKIRVACSLGMEESRESGMLHESCTYDAPSDETWKVEIYR